MISLVAALVQHDRDALAAAGAYDLPDADPYLAALDAAGGRRLQWILPSHYDADHLGDVKAVATAPGVSVGKVFDRGGDRNAKDSATYRSYYDWVTSGAVVRSPVASVPASACAAGPTP